MPQEMVSLAIAIAATVLGLVVAVTLLRRRANSTRHETFVERCAAIGLTPVNGAGGSLVCGGELAGYRALAIHVEQRMNGVDLGPRIDLFLDAALVGPRQGGAMLQPGTVFRPGKDPTFAPLLTAELTALVAAELAGCFGVSAVDSLVPTASLHQLARAKWGAQWTGLMVRTWVALEADPQAIQRALEALVRAREALAKAPGVSQR